MKSGGFMIHGLIRFELLGQELWITTTHVSLLTVMLILCVFALVVRKTMKTTKALPAGFQNAAEMMVEMLDRMTENGMGPYAPKFADYISSIFLFVLVSNLSGLLGVRPPTADYGVALALGLMTFAVVQYCNIRYNKARALTELFRPIPLLFPINLIGELSAPFSLSLRLFGNVLSGTVMMSLIYTLLSPFAVVWPAFMHLYFDVFSGSIQTYVFCMLTMVLIRQKLPQSYRSKKRKNTSHPKNKIS